MQKITLPCLPTRLTPSRDVEIEPDRVLANDVVLPWESHPHKMRLWAIGNEFGPVCAAWASCEQDALDGMVDNDLGNSFLVSDPDDESISDGEREDWAYLGNASEPCDLTYAWIQPVDLAKCEPRILCAFAEARGSGADLLSEVI